MIIALNGYPGVGKLTIGKDLADILHGRMLDIHSVYNVAFALTDFKSPEFIETVEQIEAIAHNLILKLPSDEPVVITTVLAGEDEWGDQEWRRIADLGAARPPFLVVHLTCSLEENKRRIASEDRILKHKLRDPAVAVRNQTEAKPLLGLDEQHLLKLDTTDMAPSDAAKVIAHWAKAI